MEDKEIVALYWRRDERAISESHEKYGSYLMKIADNILKDLRDSEESVNDTYLRAWNSMPPNRPDVLKLYLGRITRGVAIDIFRRRSSKKRAGSQYALSLEELGDCVSGDDDPQLSAEQSALAAAVGAYLKALDKRTRDVFICRYYFMDPLSEIADYCQMTESAVKSLLHRTRQGLRRHLEQEGFEP